MNCDFFINDFNLKIEASENNVHIEDSYRIKKSKDMKKVLNHIKSKVPEEYIVHKRTLKSQVREWRAHNLLYALHIKKEQTKSVDLDYEPTWRRCCYFILSYLYFHF